MLITVLRMETSVVYSLIQPLLSANLGTSPWRGWAKVDGVRMPSDMVKKQPPSTIALVKGPLRDLIHYILQHDVNERPSMEDVLKKLSKL